MEMRGIRRNRQGGTKTVNISWLQLSLAGRWGRMTDLWALPG
jgi:hypothetical protein